MRLKREDKHKIISMLCVSAFPRKLFDDTVRPAIEWIESTVPFQQAVKIYENYPEYTAGVNVIVFSSKLTAPGWMTFRQFQAETSCDYAERVSTKYTYSCWNPITIDLTQQDIAIENLFSEPYSIKGSAVEDLFTPIVKLIRLRIGFEEILHALFQSTDSLGKILAVIPELQPMFPDEKPIRISETEKKFLAPDGLDFVRNRLKDISF